MGLCLSHCDFDLCAIVISVFSNKKKVIIMKLYFLKIHNPEKLNILMMLWEIALVSVSAECSRSHYVLLYCIDARCII